MTSRRRFPHALLVIAAITVATGAVSTTASAATPVWSDTPEVLTAPGEETAALGNPTANNAVSAAPDGSVTVAWVKTDGADDRLVSRTRLAATGVWGAEIPVSPAGSDVEQFQLATDDAGNSSLVWSNTGRVNAFASTRLAGSGDWSAVTQLTPDGEDVRAITVDAGHDGQAVVAWATNTAGDSAVKVRTRDVADTSWGASTTIDLVDGVEYPNSVNLDFNPAGDGVLLFAEGYSGHDNRLRAVRYDHGNDSWTTHAVETVANEPGFTNMIDVALAPDGDALAVWANDNLVTHANAMSATSGSWGDPDNLHELGSSSSVMRVVPGVASDAEGTFVVTWQELSSYTPIIAAAMTSTFDGASWTGDVLLPGAETGGGVALAANNDGDMAATYLAGDISDFDHVALFSAFRPSGGDWGPAIQISGASTAGGYAIPRASLDEAGNFSAIWAASDGSLHPLMFSVADVTAPMIGASSIPANATVGVPFTVSIGEASDLWSDVTTDAYFGYDATVSGDTVTYRSPGSKTVTVTATDDAGNTATQTHTIAVGDASAPTPARPPVQEVDEDKAPVVPPKKVLAPIIEARLSGRTVTLNARVKLRQGRRCTGKAIATTKFGNRSYRTTLRLKLRGSTCLATGKIKLKKTPSTRTKLRIRISSSGAPTRTLSTKRA